MFGMEVSLVGQRTIVMHSKGKKPWMHHITKRPTTVAHRDGVILLVGRTILLNDILHWLIFLPGTARAERYLK